jgi:hypothetical protein
MFLIPSHKQTKNWRQQQTWYKNGKRNECETYQLNQLKLITGLDINRSNKRIHKLKECIVYENSPFNKKDGFEYTENFDGECMIESQTILFNLKFVCGSGGAQTRTLKQVYDFIKSQQYVIDKDIIIINILDGDESYRHCEKFEYLKTILMCKKYLRYSNLFIGSLHEFRQWWIRRYVINHIGN